ncbi:MAG: hypothetical protein IKF45_04155 [Lachnospiraceae bacterium]|nr:hypothetical protein [Lachnospiraceae bacterium]
MNAISQIKIRLDPYLRALPDIFNYQIATKILLALWLFLLGRVFQVLLRSTGRVAVTTGDWQFLFTTWQGIFILLLALIAPIVGVGVSISLTEGLYIPTFISSTPRRGQKGPGLNRKREGLSEALPVHRCGRTDHRQRQPGHRTCDGAGTPL